MFPMHRKQDIYTSSHGHSVLNYQRSVRRPNGKPRFQQKSGLAKTMGYPVGFQ